MAENTGESGVKSPKLVHLHHAQGVPISDFSRGLLVVGQGDERKGPIWAMKKSLVVYGI